MSFLSRIYEITSDKVKAIPIPANADLNAYVTTSGYSGFYYCISNGTASTISNTARAGTAFALEVISIGTTATIQRFITFNDCTVYIRRYYNSTWTDWTNITDASGITLANTTDVDTNVKSYETVRDAIEDIDGRVDKLESFSALSSNNVSLFVGPPCPSAMDNWRKVESFSSRFGSYFGDGTGTDPYSSINLALSKFNEYRATGSMNFYATLYPGSYNLKCAYFKSYAAWTCVSKPTTGAYAKAPSILYSHSPLEDGIKCSTYEKDETRLLSGLYFNLGTVGFIGALYEGSCTEGANGAYVAPSFSTATKLTGTSVSKDSILGTYIKRSNDQYHTSLGSKALFIKLYIYTGAVTGTYTQGNDTTTYGFSEANFKDTGVVYRLSAIQDYGANSTVFSGETIEFNHVDCTIKHGIYIQGYTSAETMPANRYDKSEARILMIPQVYHPSGHSYMSVRCRTSFTNIRFECKDIKYDTIRKGGPNAGGPYTYGQNASTRYTACELVNLVATAQLNGNDPNGHSSMLYCCMDNSELVKWTQGKVYTADGTDPSTVYSFKNGKWVNNLNEELVINENNYANIRRVRPEFSDEFTVIKNTNGAFVWKNNRTGALTHISDVVYYYGSGITIKGQCYVARCVFKNCNSGIYATGNLAKPSTAASFMYYNGMSDWYTNTKLIFINCHRAIAADYGAQFSKSYTLVKGSTQYLYNEDIPVTFDTNGTPHAYLVLNLYTGEVTKTGIAPTIENVQLTDSNIGSYIDKTFWFCTSRDDNTNIDSYVNKRKIQSSDVNGYILIEPKLKLTSDNIATYKGKTLTVYANELSTVGTTETIGDSHVEKYVGGVLQQIDVCVFIDPHPYFAEVGSFVCFGNETGNDPDVDIRYPTVKTVENDFSIVKGL